MKKPEDKLDTITDIYIRQKGTERSMQGFRTFLESYLSNLSRDNGIPSRNSPDWHRLVMQLEDNPETWQQAQEIWNASWLLDEVRNILSSLDQINVCLEEKQKLEQERLV